MINQFTESWHMEETCDISSTPILQNKPRRYLSN